VKQLRALSFFATLLAMAGCGPATTVTSQPVPSLPPAQGKIGHVVILIQENRSFNNLFMGFPGADTATHGLCKAGPRWCRTAREVTMRPIPLEDGHHIGGKDLDHSHHGYLIECDRDPATKVCRMDGFDLISLGETGQQGPAKLYPYAFVERSETKQYWDFAHHYALADQMFSTDTASSFIAHQEILSGTVRIDANTSLTDQPNRTPWGCDAPKGTKVPIIKANGLWFETSKYFPCFTQYGSIADLLDAAGVSWRFYVDAMFASEPHYDFSGGVWNGFDAIKKVRYGPDWKNIVIPNTTIFSDLKGGTLPQVSWVIPTLCDSDHPGAGDNGGPRWVTQVVNAIGKSQYWNDTAIVLFWDDWGGWYDNVPPREIDYTSLGFRVPMVVISPYAKPGVVSHTIYDIGSILKFVEQTFGLGSLGTTDATANSIGDVFDFTQAPAAFKPEGVPGARSCPKGGAREIIDRAGGVPE
jgi:phospholipase C